MIGITLAGILALSNAGLLDGLATEWALGGRSVMSSRFEENDGVSDDITEADLELHGNLRLSTRRLRLGGTYDPTFAAYTPWSDPTTVVRQRAAVDAAWQVTPLWTVSAGVQGAYGEFRLDPADRLDPAAPFDPTDGIERIPTSEIVKRKSLEPSLGFEGTPTRRTRLRGRLSYAYDDAIARDGRTVLEPQRAVRGQGDVEWDATRRDVLGLRGEAQVLRVDPVIGPLDRVGIAQGTARLRHAFSTTASAWGAVGVGVSYDDATAEFGAAGELGAEQRRLLRTRASGRISLRFAPAFDRVASEVRNRLQLDAGASVPLVEHVRLDGTLSAGTLSDGLAQTARLASGEARATWSITRQLDLSAAYGHFVQLSDDAPRVLRQRTVSAALALRLR